MKKFLSAVLTCALFLTSTGAYALTAKQEGARTVVLEGSTGEANALVAIDVYVSGKTRDDLETMKENGGNILDVLGARFQVEADENGDFEASFDMALPTGKYTAYAGTLNKELEPLTFIFVSDTDYNDFANGFGGAQSSDIEKIINDSTQCYILGISEEEAKNTDAKSLAVVIKNTLYESGVDLKDRDKVWAEVDRAYFVEQLNEGKIDDITKVDDTLSGLSKSAAAKWLEKEIASSAVKKNCTERLQKQGFDSVKAYENSILEAFVLAVVENPSGVSDVKEIVTEFKKEIGVNVTSSTPKSVWNKLSGKNYKDFAALIKAFNGYVDEGDKIGSQTGGGNGKKPQISGEITVPPSGVSPTPITGFKDLDEAPWAKEAINALADKNIVNGVENGKFNPNGLITREQFAKIVVGAFASDNELADIDFADVEKGTWYYEFIAKAYAAGITKGMGDKTFGVGRNITRQDMCVMIFNAAKAAGMKFDASSERFNDHALISDYAVEAVYALKNCGAVSGMDEFNFAPRETATRAQAAKIIYNLIAQ